MYNKKIYLPRDGPLNLGVNCKFNKLMCFYSPCYAGIN